ncbi:MAG: hypothetical protein ACTHMO_08040 [Rhodanobacteraceae bacterium]
MNASKPLTFAASLLIASAGIVGIRAYANASAQRVLPAAVGTTAQPQPLQTLPAIVVRPTAADYERAFGHAAHASGSKGLDSASLEGTGIDMPYYSFAEPAVGVR